MGLFHDKCMAIVDAVTGEALRDGELLEAKEQQQKFFSGHTLSSGRKWRICGNSVSKKARVCSQCGTRAPGGWIKCPACHEWIGNDARFCPHCNHPLHPGERIDFAGGIWDHDAGKFAQRFEIEDGAKILKQGIHVQEGTVAVLLDSGKESGVLGPGRHDPAGSLRNINWFGNPPPRSVLMVDNGDVVFKLDFPGLRSADELPVSLVADVTLHFAPSHVGDFIANVLKNERSISYEAIGNWLKDECLYAAKNLCLKTTVEDLVKDPERRTMFEDELGRAIRELLKRTGLEFVRVGAVDFISADFEKMRVQYGEFDARRRQFEFDQKVMEFAASQEVAALADAHGKIDRSNGDAEFIAKKEQELSEYLDQLAQEKGIAAIDRAEEMEVVKLVSRGRISAKEAEERLARLQEDHAEKMAALGDKLELDLAVSNYDREEQIRKAEHNARLADVARAEALKDAENTVVIYGTKVVGEAKADAEAEVYKTKQVISQQEARKVTVETDIFEAQEWVKVQAAKQDVELKAEKERANIVKGMSAVELAAIADDPSARADFLRHAGQLLQKDMSPEQILATLAGSSSSAADALKTMYAAKEGAASQLLGEMKKIYDNSLNREDKQSERYAQLVERLAGMMSETASVAAKRVDPAPAVPSQQIIK